jgi:hypothetical protein
MDITRFGVDIHHASVREFSHKGKEPERTSEQMFEQDRSQTVSAMVEAGKITGKTVKTATLELTTFEWGIIQIALNEAQTMPNSSKQLSEEISELVAVQTK